METLDDLAAAIKARMAFIQERKMQETQTTNALIKAFHEFFDFNNPEFRKNFEQGVDDLLKENGDVIGFRIEKGGKQKPNSNEFEYFFKLVQFPTKICRASYFTCYTGLIIKHKSAIAPTYKTWLDIGYEFFDTVEKDFPYIFLKYKDYSVYIFNIENAFRSICPIKGVNIGEMNRHVRYFIQWCMIGMYPRFAPLVNKVIKDVYQRNIPLAVAVIGNSNAPVYRGLYNRLLFTGEPNSHLIIGKTEKGLLLQTAISSMGNYITKERIKTILSQKYPAFTKIKSVNNFLTDHINKTKLMNETFNFKNTPTHYTDALKNAITGSANRIKSEYSAFANEQIEGIQNILDKEKYDIRKFIDEHLMESDSTSRTASSDTGVNIPAEPTNRDFPVYG